MKKRVLGLLCVLSVLLSVFANTSYAYTNVSDRALLDLRAFGIMEGDESGELNLDNNVTRAEFSKMTVAALNASDMIGLNCEFTDVEEDDWFYNSVALLNNMGLINGYEDGSFRPNANVTYNEAVKIIVCALGYYNVAESSGGYPNGYLTVATSLGLTKNVSPDSETLLRRDVAMLFYNALDINRMSQEFGSGEYQTIEGDTLRNLHLRGTGEEMRSGRGIITATVETWLNQPNSAVDNDEVEIDGEIYKVGDTNAIALLGQEVDYYAESTDEGYVLTAVTPTNKNSTLIIDYEEFEGISGGRIRYREDGDRERSYALSDSIRVVSNLVPLNDVVLDEITLDYGSIRLIDNTGDSQAYVMFIEEINSLPVDRVRGSRIYFADGYRLHDMEYIELDAENDDVKFSLTNADGTAINVEDIGEKNIISVIISDDASRIRCTVSDTAVTGTISSISVSDDTVVIDDQEYKLANSELLDDDSVSAGQSVTAYLDYLGNVAWFEAGTSLKQYAYVISAAEYYEGDTLYGLRCVFPGPMQVEEEEVQSDDENDDSTVPVLKAGNSDYEMLYLADSVSIDGRTYRGADRANALSILDQYVIEYTLDSDGYISRVEFPEIIGDDVPYKMYNAYERVFGGYGNGVFGIDDNSMGICVPTNEITDTRDYLATVKLEDAQRYRVSGYNIDDNTLNAELIVLHETLDIDASEPINDYSPIAIVAEKSRVITEDDEEATRIVLYSEGEEHEFVVPDSDEAAGDAARLERGTVLYYATTVSGNLSRVEIVENLRDLSSTYDEGSSSTERRVFADLLNVDSNTLNDVRYRRVNRLYLSTEVGETTVDINRRNPPDIYEYNRLTGEVKAITVDDVEPDWNTGETVRVFIHIEYDNVKGVIVVKG